MQRNGRRRLSSDHLWQTLIERGLRARSASFGRRLAAAAVAVTVILTGSTAGYVLIEDAAWFDAFYMAVITLATVGYSEHVPLGTGGRLFTIFVMVVGVGTILYVASLLAEYLLSGQLGEFIGERRMNMHITGLSDHYIVCGYGRTGRRVALELKREGREVVVVDQSDTAVAAAINDGFPAVPGDSGDDDILRQAGIERAAGMVAAVSPDSNGVMAVFSARALNPGLHIVARAQYEISESKLLSAGADRVMSVYRIAGHRLAQLVSRPELAEFLEVVLSDHEVELEMDMVRLSDNSPFDGMELRQSGLMDAAGANIVGVRKQGGTVTVLATAGTLLSSGDVLLAIGTREHLEELKKAVGVEKE